MPIPHSYPRCHFGGVVLESLQRSDLAFEDHHIVAQQPDFGVARDLAVGDVATGDDTDLRKTEGVSNFGGTQIRFLDRSGSSTPSMAPLISSTTL